jgi:histone deacetylase 1/2
MQRKKNVAYFYTPETTKFHYGSDHPMKPKRITMTHQMITAYGMLKYMDCYV